MERTNPDNVAAKKIGDVRPNQRLERVASHRSAAATLDALAMAPEKTSTLALVWATRPGGGGATERRYRDFVVDGVPLSTIIKSDVISPFGWLVLDEQVAAADRLLRRATPDLPAGRVSLYVCPECGDLGCGAVSVVIEGAAGGVLWRDFAFQNNYEDSIHRSGFETVGPFLFDGRAYHQVLDELKRDAERSGV